MVKKAVGRAKELDLEDIKKLIEDATKEIVIKRNEIRAELGEPLIEA